MKLKNWKDTGELIGISAILIGLAFVYAELHQNGIIARAEMSAESTHMFLMLEEHESQTEFARILIKSRENPKELTSTERLQLNAHLLGVLRIYTRERYYYELGIFDEWVSWINSSATRYFDSGYGKAYWDVRKRAFPAEIAKAVDDALSNSKAIKFDRDFDVEVVLQLDKIE